MLVQCPQCSAAYEFPAERLPEDGLRAKCARCGCIMRVRPPTPDGEARVERSNALVRRPGRALNTAQSVPPKVLDAPAEAPSAASIEARSTARRAMDEGDDEPSIIIDMGQLNDLPAPEVKTDSTALTPAPPPAALFTPFAPSAAAPAAAPEARHRVRAEVFPVDTAIEADLAASIRPRPIGRMVLAIGVLLLGGFVLFVAWRNEFGPIWRDPQAAVRVAFGLHTPPAPAPPVAPVVEETAPGELVVRQVELEWLDRSTVILRGQVVNESSRNQRSIGIEVGVTRDGLALRSRVVPCCEELTPEQVQKIIRDSAHPHFADGKGGTLTLAPAEARTFTAIIRDLPPQAREAAEPLARIRYSEAERVAPR
jgi:predicted Zn finger-like uncharacterized protein